MPEMDKAIDAEQIRVLFKEASVAAPAGALVLSITTWATSPFVPLWTWVPALVLNWAVTVGCAYLIHLHRKRPEAMAPAQWGNSQVIAYALIGVSWGFAVTAMCAYLPLAYSSFVIAVESVVVAAFAFDGFARVSPPRALIWPALVPVLVWCYLVGDRLHFTIAILLTIYIPILYWKSSMIHRPFLDSLKLRFQNEFLAKELSRQVEIAEAAAKDKARFLAAASHDLRQPVQALTFFHELIRAEMTLTSQGEAHFAMARQSVKAVHDLLDALLDISRLDAETIQVQRERFAVAESLDQMRTEFAAPARMKGIDLRIAPSSAQLDTDPMLLGQLLRNLVANALRYTPAGKVLVGCRRRHERLDIEVWDTGIGIRADQQRAIFGEFFQVGNPERDRQKGLGLGLAIVDRVAKLLGATVAVRSTPGKGSCFSVSLPYAAAAALPARPAVEAGDAAAPVGLDGRLVVVVENEDMIRQAIHALLEKWGCDVISGPCRDSIWTQVQGVGRAVSAVISDFGLPGDENGIDVIREFRRQLGYECAALLITGDTSSAVLQAANGAGFTLLHKPIEPELLHRTLSTAMAR